MSGIIDMYARSIPEMRAERDAMNVALSRPQYYSRAQLWAFRRRRDELVRRLRETSNGQI